MKLHRIASFICLLQTIDFNQLYISKKNVKMKIKYANFSRVPRLFSSAFNKCLNPYS